MGTTHEKPVFLLAIRGTLAPATVAAARTIHNATAGAPPNVAAARSLGDLSHMVYVPTLKAKAGAGEFLILDLWNSMEGLNQFFAKAQVQAQAGQIFGARDPVVWAPAEGFNRYHLPAPHGKNDRIVSVVRGEVKSRTEAEAVHNEFVGAQVNKARMAGALTHDTYFRLTPPGTPESLEFFAVDTWMEAAGMNEYYANPDFLGGVQKLFVGQPVTSTWQHPEGEWVEW
jgi:hypothetical protein